MVSSTLLVWGIFMIIFGGAGIYWWFDGGYKKWLKYKKDYKEEKEK